MCGEERWLRGFHVQKTGRSREEKSLSVTTSTSTIANSSESFVKKMLIRAKRQIASRCQITPPRYPPIFRDPTTRIQPFQTVCSTVFATNKLYSLLLQVLADGVVIIYCYCYWHECCHRGKTHTIYE
jgi:hypothetical protein